MTRRASLFVIGVALVALVGCDSDRPVESKLVPLASCGELEQTLRTAALQQMNQRIDEARDSAIQGSSRCYYGDAELNAMGDGRASPAPSASSGATTGGTSTSTGASQVSGTNNQVAGVDEADFIKNDNKFIYLVAGGALRILQAWPAPTTQEIAKVSVEGTPSKLFVQGDRALVYSSLPASQANGKAWTGSGQECTYGYSCSFVGDGNPTKISVFDIADRKAPRLVRELRLSGSYVNARRIGNAVHTVISSPGVKFPGLTYWPQGLNQCNAATTVIDIYIAFAQLRAKNTKIIMDTPLTDFVPSVTDKVLEGDTRTSADILGGCASFYRPSLSDGDTFTTILSLDMTVDQPAATATIVSGPGAVYASENGLYLAMPQQHRAGDAWFPSMDSAAEATTVHRFALRNTSARAAYAGSGVVKGRVLNQFSMDEHAGHLRIATTTGHLPASDVHSTLSVLKPDGSALPTVGVLDKLAPKEDIRSVRFDGERGFIVTFKKTDPLFVLDLADPTQPRVLAELKIPGFSTYMQLMDKQHLLTIGYDASDQGSFAWFTGVLLQIFDITDPTAPTLAHKEVIGTRGSSSEALTNHLAFTYFAPKDLLALPMTICEGGNGNGMYGTTMSFSGLMVYKVTTQAGFALNGRVTHATTGASCSNWWTNAKSVVRRSIIMDDYVFSVTDALVKVNDLRDLAVDLAAVPVDK